VFVLVIADGRRTASLRAPESIGLHPGWLPEVGFQVSRERHAGGSSQDKGQHSRVRRCILVVDPWLPGPLLPGVCVARGNGPLIRNQHPDICAGPNGNAGEDAVHGLEMLGPVSVREERERGAPGRGQEILVPSVKKQGDKATARTPQRMNEGIRVGRRPRGAWGGVDDGSVMTEPMDGSE